ncbi:hypothetical protein KUF71_018765 [Frankliniella fusca]|uniref:Mucin-5AC-like n=1 Tax=Frankliniella fusca TaxID=407009 RepID=A0AAE1GSR0_9NEOP|nr:hypothetical protein KUF71_018765 [Frankliniella fusca]
MASCRCALGLLLLLAAACCGYPAATFPETVFPVRGGRSLPGSVLRLTHWPWYTSLAPHRQTSLVSSASSSWGVFSRPIATPLRATHLQLAHRHTTPQRPTPVWELPPLFAPVHEQRPKTDFVVISLAPTSIASRRPPRYDFMPAAPTPSPAAPTLAPTPGWVRVATAGTPLYDLVETVQSGARPNLVIRRPATGRVPMTPGTPPTTTTTTGIPFSWPSTPLTTAVWVAPPRGDQPARPGEERESATGAAAGPAGPAAGATTPTPPPDRNTNGDAAVSTTGALLVDVTGAPGSTTLLDTTPSTASSTAESPGEVSTVAPHEKTTAVEYVVVETTITPAAAASAAVPNATVSSTTIHPAADIIVFDSILSSASSSLVPHATTPAQPSSVPVAVTTDAPITVTSDAPVVTTAQQDTEIEGVTETTATTGHLYHRETVTATYEPLVTTEQAVLANTTSVTAGLPASEITTPVTEEFHATTTEATYQETVAVTSEPDVSTAGPVSTQTLLIPFVTADPSTTTEILDTVEIEINRRGKPDVTSTTSEPTTEAFSPLAVAALETTFPPSEETTITTASPGVRTDLPPTVSTTFTPSDVSLIFTTEAPSTFSTSAEASSTHSATTEVLSTTPADSVSTYSAGGFTVSNADISTPVTTWAEVNTEPVSVLTTLPAEGYTTGAAGAYSAPVEQTTGAAYSTAYDQEATTSEAPTPSDTPSTLFEETVTPATLTSLHPYNLEEASTTTGYTTTTASPNDVSTVFPEAYTVASGETFWTTVATQSGAGETPSTVEAGTAGTTEGFTSTVRGNAYAAGTTTVVTEAPAATEVAVSTTTTSSPATTTPVTTTTSGAPKEAVPTSAPVKDFNYYDGVAFEDGTSLGGSPADGYIPDYDSRSDEYDGDYFADSARPRLPLLPPPTSDTKGLEIASLVRETPAPPKKISHRRGDVPIDDDGDDDDEGESNDVGFGSDNQVTVLFPSTPKPIGDTFEGQMLRRMVPLVVRQLRLGHLSGEDMTRLKYIFGPIWPEVEEMARVVALGAGPGPGLSRAPRARRDASRYPHFRRWRGVEDELGSESGLARRSTLTSGEARRPAPLPARRPARRRRTRKHPKHPKHTHKAHKSHKLKQDGNKTHPAKHDDKATPDKQEVEAQPAKPDANAHPARKHDRKPKHHKHKLHVKPEAAVSRPKRSSSPPAAKVGPDVDEEYDYEDEKDADYMGDEDYYEAEDGEEEGEDVSADGDVDADGDVGADGDDEYDEEYEDDGDIAPPRVLDNDNPSVMELHYRARQAQGHVPEERTSPINKDLAAAQAESVEDMAKDVADYEYY